MDYYSPATADYVKKGENEEKLTKCYIIFLNIKVSTVLNSIQYLQGIIGLIKGNVGMWVC